MIKVLKIPDAKYKAIKFFIKFAVDFESKDRLKNANSGNILKILWLIIIYFVI